MSKKVKSHDMADHILSATELLLAKEGLQNLSMRNIAKQAGIATGTLYLYFKTKDELLDYLAEQLHERYYRYVNIDFDPKVPLFEQYRQIWLNKRHFLEDNPMMAANLYQYQAMLGFNNIVNRIMNDPEFIWNRFVAEGKAQKIIVDLPNDLLYCMSIGVVADIAYLEQVKQESISKEFFEESILRTWKAITF
ncbi:TetR/AcrR family transcriptional regulator [Actinobacillus arthritidis]|uniref:TetR/AcrR family transcriptional regulator n=1 Tax=Actinobacillus arthritidis TaxID=157339 RepID=UPI002441F452|nr:TetR/AcrR family transcriptional regulator [Actinobacillus arthritidis]WGE89901.1 TetR/AcrR family transcriptional regulator [Actinobacillus arthritidis]